jgi:hypothetical protein
VSVNFEDKHPWDLAASHCGKANEIELQEWEGAEAIALNGADRAEGLSCLLARPAVVAPY